MARAFVAGDLTVEGDLFALLRVLHDASPARSPPDRLRALPTVVAARPTDLGALGPPLPPPPEECRPPGRLHSPARDAVVVSHHYDVGNAFYRLVLGAEHDLLVRPVRHAPRPPSRTPRRPSTSSICRKLGLDRRPGTRLLDVGCGWGSMAIHAARPPGARVVGVTLSREQVDEATRRVAEAGPRRPGRDPPAGLPRPAGRALRRHLVDRHVRARRHGPHGPATSRRSARLLGPEGRLLNHAISKPGGSALGRRSFVGRYVFPDGELVDVAEVVGAMQRTGFEVRDVESLREHYSRTLHHWVANLEAHWDEAVALVGPPRANIWRLYMAASANGFDDGGLAIHQVLGVVPGPTGGSGMPPTRRAGTDLATGRRTARSGSADGELLAVDAGRAELGDRRGQPVEDGRRLAVRIGHHHRHPVVPALAEGRHQRHLGQQRHAELVGQLAHRPRRRTARSGCRRHR